MNFIMNLLKSRRGVTLIELLVVVVILGIIAAVVIPSVSGNQEEAYKKTNLQNKKIVEDAVARYKVLNNNLNPTMADLIGNTAKGAPFLLEEPKVWIRDTDNIVSQTGTFTISAGVVAYPTEAIKD